MTGYFIIGKNHRSKSTSSVNKEYWLLGNLLHTINKLNGSGSGYRLFALIQGDKG